MLLQLHEAACIYTLPPSSAHQMHTTKLLIKLANQLLSLSHFVQFGAC